jgi:hypothetical protein
MKEQKKNSKTSASPLDVDPQDVGTTRVTEGESYKTVRAI